jgi:transcriptional regulator with XRE-family HTH domain
MHNHEGERLRNYLRIHKVTQDGFASEMGMSRNTLINYLRMAELPASFKVQLAGTQYAEWAIAQIDSEATPITTTPNIKQVPLVSQYAYAGYLSGFADQEYLDELPSVPFKSEKEPKGVYVAFEIRGDSMNDGSVNSYLPGDIVIGRQINKDYWKAKLHLHDWDFVIVHKTDGILIKQISKHDVDKGLITCHSLNKASIYADFELKLADVYQLFNIIEVKRRK